MNTKRSLQKLLNVIFAALVLFIFSEHLEAQEMAATQVRITSNLILIPVKINDRGPYNFVLDLGSDTTQIDQELLKDVGFVPSSKVVLSTINGDVLLPAGRASVQIGSYKDFIEVVATNFSKEGFFVQYGIKGLLGINALQNLGIVFDKKNRALTLIKNPIAMEGVEIKPIDKLKTVRIKVGDMEKTFLIDTGIQNPILFLPKKESVDLVTVSTVSGSATLNSNFRKLKYSIGDLSKNETFVFIDRSGLPYDGLFPLQLLDFFYLDAKNNRLIVSSKQFLEELGSK